MAKCEAVHCREKMSLSSLCSALGKGNAPWKSTVNLSVYRLDYEVKVMGERKSGRNYF